MKYKFILNMIALFFFTSCTENKIENNLTEENLKGKVKSVKEVSYDAIEKFGEVAKGRVLNWGRENKQMIYSEKGSKIEENHFNSKGELEWKYMYKYDEKDNQIEESVYDSKGELVRKNTFKYDEKNNKIEENGYNSNRELVYGYIYTYKYDNKGNQVECKQNKHNSEGQLEPKMWTKLLIYKYDEKGNLIEEKECNYNGELCNKNTYKYDKKRNKIEEQIYNFVGELNYKYNYKYDERGNLKEKKEINSEGKIVKSTYKHDEKGNLLQENFYDFNEELDSKYTYKYKYDKKGNWIERIKYTITDFPNEITEREIEYYN